MLSQPIPPEEATSVAIILSNIISTTVLNLVVSFMSLSTKSTASYDVKQSQIPSQAMIKNCVFSSMFYFLMSGLAVII